jgi:hypothetical protein
MHMKIMKILRIVVLPVLLLALFTCEDTLTSLIQEDVRIASLPDRVLSILPPSNGSVIPVGTTSIKDNEPLGIAATANSGYTFVNWLQISGSGAVTFDNENAASTILRLTGGDAVVQPIISNTLYDLTISNDGNGTTNPSGLVQVANGQPRAISATPNGAAGYEFKNWTQTLGPGAASFDSATSASTNVTVTGDSATIQANFQLKHYTVTLSNDGHGTTTPSTPLDLTHGIPSSSISTTPATGYRFKNWTVTAGTGIAFTPGATTTPVTITATGGNATVQANFELIPYTLTISYGTGGWANPYGAQTVYYGVPFQLHAYPYGTFMFQNWTKTAGTGTVVFSNASDANATATVTGGNATIQANFRKEVVSFVSVATMDFETAFTTWPHSTSDISLWGSYLYVAGRDWPASSNSVVRRFNISNPTGPTSGGSDYKYINGSTANIDTDGTYLFAGTSSTTYRIRLSDFPSTTASVVEGSSDISVWPQDSHGTYWTAALTGFQSGNLVDRFKSTLAEDPSGYNQISDSAGRSFDFIQKIWGGLLAVLNDNDINWLASYSIPDGTTAASWTAPDSEILAHNGGDMDFGWTGRIAMHPDQEIAVLPVGDQDGFRVRLFDITDPAGIGVLGSTDVTGDILSVTVDDYYVYVAATQGSAPPKAYVYAIDMSNSALPVIRTTTEIVGYYKANLVAVSGNYLFVIVENSSGNLTLKVLRIDKS